MGNSFRPQPGPAVYGENKTPVTSDLLQVGLLVAFAMIAFSFLLILPGIRGSERIWAFLRVTVALWIGAVLLVCNFGSWYNGNVCTRAWYKSHTVKNIPQTIQAEVGLSIGLRGINITLFERDCGATQKEYVRPFPDEVINYNEQFRWSEPWGQGRLDFGIFGGSFNQEYRAAKFRGLPYPITWVAEFFTLDGEQIVWYRKFRQAGWFTHIFMWTAFATYLISILLFIYDIHHGAIFMMITGLLMILSSASFGIIIVNDPAFEIHFWDAILKPTFNYSFYLVLVTGVLTWLLSLLILLINYLSPRKAAKIFHHSIIEDDSIFEGLVEEEDEFGIVRRVSRTSYKPGAGAESSTGEPGRGVWRMIHRRNGTKRASVRSTRSDTQERSGRADVVRRISESAMVASEFQEVSHETHTQTVTIPLEEISIHS